MCSANIHIHCYIERVRNMPGGTDKMTKDIRTSLREVATRGGRYFKGTAQLFLASGSEFVDNKLPTVGAMVETNRELLQDTARFLRNPVDAVNRTINKAMDTPDFKALKKFGKAMVDDLKSGELYNADRMRSSFGETVDDLLDGFGDFDMSGFGEDGEWTEPEGDAGFDKEAKLAESQEQAADTRTSSTISAIGLGTDALVHTANANAQTNIRLSLKQHSQLMAGVQNMVTQQAATLQAVNQTAISLLDVTREAYQQIMTGIEGISTTLQRIEKNTAPVQPERASVREELEVIGSNGELNIANWLKQIKKNADDKYNISSMLTMATGGMGISALLEQVGDNPWQLVSDALLQRMLPPSLKKQFDITGKKLEGFFPALLSKLNDRGKRYGSGESNKLSDFFAGLLGYEERSRRTIDTTTRDPSAQAMFTNRTAQAIENVIPMWLSKIHSALTGDEEQVFDYGAGKFTRVVDVLSQTSNSVNDLANRMGNAAGNFLDLAKSVRFENANMEGKFHDYLYRYLQTQAERGQFIDPFVSKEKFKETMPSVTDGDSDLYYKIINSALRRMDRTDLLALSSEIQGARQSRHKANTAINNRIRDNGTWIAFSDAIDKQKSRAVINKSQDTAYGLRGQDMEDVLEKQRASALRRGGAQAINIHLNDISSMLRRGIVTYTYIMGSAFSTEGLPPGIARTMTEARKAAEDEQKNKFDVSAERDERARQNRQDRERLIRERRQQQVNRIERDPGEWYVNGDTNQGYIDQMLAETRLRQRASTDTLFDNPDVERTSKTGYEAGQRDLRDKMARASRDMNERLDKSKFGGLVETVREYGKVPFELVENGLKLVDSFLFRVLYGEDASDVMLDEHKLPSILDAVRINVKAQWLEAGNWFAKNIGDPLKKSLFDSEEGIIPRIANRLNGKVVEPVKNKVKDYKNKLIGAREVGEDGKPIGDYVGGRFSDKINAIRHRADDVKSGITSGAKSSFTSTINKWLYGDNVEGKGVGHSLQQVGTTKTKRGYTDRTGYHEEEVETPILADVQEFTGIIGSLKKHALDIRGMLFGEDENGDDHDSWNKFNLVRDEIKKAFPDMTIGAGLGLLGSFFLPGGPILGAMLGSAGGFVASSEKFKEYLFGEQIAEDTQMRFNYKTGKIEETKVKSRSGRIIDKQIYDAFKKFAPNIAIGSGLGIVGSMFLPGGPMIGALMGGIGGMVSASDQMKELIFGKYTDKDGNVKDGLLGPKTREAIKNAAGPALGGAVLGGTAWSMISSLGIIPGLSLLPGGPIFTMLGGITGAMNADAIKNFFFGKEEEGTEEVKDENGNVTGTKKVKKRVGGLFGTAFDFAKTKMIEPFAKRINAAGEKIGEWFNESVVSPFRNAIAPIKEHMKRAGTAISDSMKNIGEHIKDSIAKMFSNPDDPDDPREQMKRFFKDKLITPLDNAVKKIFSTIGKIIGSIISAPFKALEFIATGTIGGKSPEELSDERAAASKARQAERDKKRTERTKGRLGRIWGKVGGRLGKIFGKYAPGDDAEAQEAEARPEQGDRYVRNAAGKWIDAKTKRSVSDAEVEGYQRSQSASAGEKRGIFSRIASIFKRDDSGAENLGPGVNRNRQKEQVVADESAKKDKDASARDSERDRLAQKEEKRTRGKADASANESEGQTAMAGEDGGKAKKSITGRKSNNEYLCSIDRHTGRIYDEIKGQLGGSGWNIAYIKTLLDKHFGKLNDDELPEEMEGSKKVKKRRGFFGRILDRVEGVFHSVTDAVGGAVERAVGVITAPFKLVGKVITGLKDAVVGATTTLWGIAKTLGSAVGELLKDAAKGLGEVMVGVGKMIRGAAGGIGEALGNVLSTFTGVLGDGILATSAVVRGLIESAAVIAPDVVATVWKGMKTVGGIIGKGVTFLGKGVVDGVTGLFGKIFGRDKDKDGEGHGFGRSKKMTIKGPVPVTIYDQGDGPDYVQYPFISTVSPVMPSRAIPVFLVGAFSDAIVTARLSKDEEPQQPAAPDSSGAPGPSPMPNIGGSDDPDQAGDIDPSAEGGGARPTNGTARKKSKLKSAMNDLRTRLHGLGSDIKGAVASAKMNHEMDRVWDNYMKSHENDKEAQADSASRALTVYKRQYSAIDAKAERSNNPTDEYDDAIKHARSMEEIQAIQASHQMNASNQMVATGQQEEEKKEGILGMLLGGLASLIFGKGGLKGALSALGKKFAGSTAGKAIGSFASKTALPFLGEAAGMAATGYQLFGENGNKLWGAETVAMDALKIGKAVAGNADEVLEKSPIKKAIAKLIKSLTTNQTVVKMFGAAKNKLGMLAAKLTNKLGGEVLEQAMKSGAQQAKGAIKQIAAFASGGTIAIAFAIADFVAGFGNAKKYFNVFGSDVSLGMRLTSGIVNTLGGLLSLIPGIGPLLSVAAAMFQDSIVQLVYGIVADDSAKEELAANQQKLQAATDKYNAENGTNLTTDEYAKKFNADGSKRGFFSNIVGGIKSVGSGIVGGAKKLGGKALDLAENIPLAGGLIKGVRGLFGGSEEEDESGKGSGWGRGPKTSISVDSLLNRVISTVSSTVKDTINMAQQAAQSNGLDTGSIGGFFKSAISDPKALVSTFLQVGKGIGGSLIDMVSDVFKGKKNGPTIFSIMGEGLGSSLIADLKNTEGKNATITNSMSTAMTASLTGGSSTAVRNAVKETKKKKGLIETVGSWMPWNWGKGAGCNDCDDWGTGRVTPMSQSSGKWNRGSDDMAKAGCGPTAAAMVASSYGAKTANPMEANRMSKVSGMRASDGGTNPKFFGKYAAAHGYGMSEGPVDSKSIASNLRKGQPVVVMGKGGAFGKNMHYMVAERDTGRGGVGIVDPLTGARKSTTMEGLVSNTKTAIYSYGKGSGWGCGPKDSVDDIWTRNSMSNEERQEKAAHTRNNPEAGKTIGDTGYTTTQAQKALVDKMASIKGQIAYSLKGGEQNPDIGKASCASTVGWAYRKVLGVNNMSAGSTTQSKDNRFSTIWVNNGTPLDPSILQPGDILYQHWDQTRNNGKMQHTEMYAGNNQDLSHGGGSNGTEYGPTYKELTPYRKSHTMMVRRYNPFIEGTNVQVYDTSTTGYSGYTGSSSGSTSGTSIAGSTQGLGMLDALSTVFSGISSKIGNILTILMGGKPEDDTGDAESTGTTETVSASGGTTFNFGSSAGVMNPTDSATAIWKFLRREGYTEPGAAGIMGCWQSESSNRADRLEGDYLKAWKSKYGTVDNVMSSNANLNDYVVNYLFPAYDRSGISISKSGYKMADGNYYPGLGLAQWTKGRAYNLMNFAKERGEDWRNLNTQLEFFKHETETSYPKLKGMLNAAQTPEEGARAGLDGFEMYSGWSSTKKGQEQWKERAMNAAQIYNAYKGTDIRTDDEKKQIEAGRARRNWTVDSDGNIVVPDSSSTTDDGETGTGWGRGPGANLSANVSIMQSRIAALNKNMESLREETASESTVAEVTRKITEAMDSATGGGGDEQQTKVLSGIYALMGKMVELLSDIKENTKQKDPGTPDETDNSYRKLPTAKPRYPNGDDTVDDVGAVTIDRLTGI